MKGDLRGLKLAASAAHDAHCTSHWLVAADARLHCCQVALQIRSCWQLKAKRRTLLNKHLS